MAKCKLSKIRYADWEPHENEFIIIQYDLGLFITRLDSCSNQIEVIWLYAHKIFVVEI